MLPDSLFSAYQQYKEDTDSVAAWLASTAKKCGYKADQLSSSGAKAGPGRLKGKARKDAKKQQQAPQVAPSAPKYIIAIKDFIPLAEHILSSTKPVIKVPAAFATTIDRLIHMRSKFGEKMRKRGVETDEDSDDNHSYFVGVLKTVRSILSPRMPVKTPESVSLEDLTNRFIGLDIQDPSQKFLDAPDLARPEKEQGDDNNYEAELQKSFQDACMACTALVNDLNDIRTTIVSIWTAVSGFRDGGVDPAVTVVTTNTGIDLARNLIEQVLPILEEHGDPCLFLEQ
ncbi:hypothetical protein NW768_006826 [Fusarium equiseti]|uniref:DUF6604 domain-containing protein n=1 Tax=Fusarium equiseti TaxID=61235 RepID=A0ABQ8R9K9_FUSEQ|nr:hypothetical protein NW768_006826 [Fusarium equiseti]